MAGNSVIGALRVNLGLNSAQFSNGLKKANGNAKSFSARMTTAFKVVGAAVAVASAVAVAAIKGTLGEMDRMSKSAKGIGLTTEELGRLKFAAELSGVPLEKLTSSVGKLSKSMADSLRSATSEQAMAFKALGVNVKNTDGTFKKSNVVLGEIADKFRDAKDSTEKTALAMSIFGRSGKELIPLLNEGSEGIEKLGDEAERLGIVFDSKTAAAAEKFNDTMTRLGKVSKGMWTQITAGLLPALQAVSSRFMSTSGTGSAMKSVVDTLVTVFNGLARGIIFVIDNITTLFQVFKVFVAAQIVSFVAAAGMSFIGLAKSIRSAGRMLSLFTLMQRMGLKGLVLLAGGVAIVTGNFELLQQEMASLWRRAKQLLPDSLQDKIEELAGSFDGYLTGIDFEPVINDAQRATKTLGQMNAVTKDASSSISSSLKGVGKQIGQLSPLGRTMANAFTNAFDAIADGSFKAREFLGGLAKDIAKMFANRAIMSLIGSVFPAGGISTRAPLDYGPFIPRASGGPVTSGSSYLVGERGPELFVPKSSGNIIPNNQMGGSQSNSSNYAPTYHIDARGSDMGEAKFRQILTDFDKQSYSKFVENYNKASLKRAI